jgi:hypothetical protein
LLTVFSVRLGWWVGNPRWDGPAQRPGPMFALRYLLDELAAQTTDRSKFLNLSDGLGRRKELFKTLRPGG